LEEAVLKLRKLYFYVFNIIYSSRIWKLKKFFSSNENVTILMYHELTDKELFKKQMAYIKNNYSVIGLECYIKSKKNQTKDIPNSSIIITFDDGCESIYSIAMPVLNRLKIRATVFIAPDLLRDNYIKTKFKIMSLEQLQNLSKSEFIDIGGHTLSHIDLGKAQYDEANKEIVDGKKVLEKIVSKEIITFAYPIGKKSNYNSDIIDIVKNNGFIGAVTTNCFKNVNIKEDSIYELNRIGIAADDTFQIFVLKINRFYPYKIIRYIAKIKSLIC